MITLTTYISKSSAERLVSSVLEAQLNATLPSGEQFQVAATVEQPVANDNTVVSTSGNEELCGLLRKDNWCDPSRKIANIKELRRLIPGLGLAVAKHLVEGGRL